MTIPFAGVFVQSFLGNFQGLSDVLGLLPDRLLQLNMAVNTFTVYEIGGRVIGSVPILLVLYPVLTIALVPMIYRAYSRAEIG